MTVPLIHRSLLRISQRADVYELGLETLDIILARCHFQEQVPCS